MERARVCLTHLKSGRKQKGKLAEQMEKGKLLLDANNMDDQGTMQHPGNGDWHLGVFLDGVIERERKGEQKGNGAVEGYSP